MPKQKKATKKFLAKKLDKELEKRKKHKAIKEKVKEKKQIVQEVEEEFSDSGDENEGFLMEDRDMGDSSEEDLAGSEEEDDEDEEDAEEEEEEEEDAEDEEKDYDPEEFQRELMKLKETDESFYNFLQENDQDLLNFDEKEEDSDEESKDEDQLLTKPEILALRNSILKNNLNSYKKLLIEFKNIANFTSKYEAKLCNLIILLVLKTTPKVFEFHPQKKTKHSIKVFFTNLILLTQKMKQMTTFILKNVQESLKYLVLYPKLFKQFQKLLISLWETGKEPVRISAFMCIRKMLLLSPGSFDMTFKLMYRAFLLICRNTTPHTWPLIQFMDNCLVEVCGLSLTMAYQHCFVNLRQIALQLRNASVGKALFKQVYNWQCLHALKLWGHVVCTFCDSDFGKDASILQPLIYPLVQVIIGVIGLKPSAKHFPLRLSLVQILINISSKTKVFIPVGSYLLSVFESSEVKQKGKPSTLKPLDFKLNIRAPNSYLGTKTFHSGLIDHTFNLLYEYFNVNSNSIAFPEMCIPAIVILKRISKHSGDFNLNKQINAIVEKLEHNSTFIINKRQGVTYGPKDLQAVMHFDASGNPFEKYCEQRRKTKERQVVQEEAFVPESEDEEQDEEPVKATKSKHKKFKEVEEDEREDDGMDEDLVEDFDLDDLDD